MHAARKMYLSCESDSRIMKALKKPLRTYAAPVTLGRKVYFKAVGSDKCNGNRTGQCCSVSPSGYLCHEDTSEQNYAGKGACFP